MRGWTLCPCAWVVEAGSGISSLLSSSEEQLVEYRTQDCLKCCVQGLVLDRWSFNLSERKAKGSTPMNTRARLLHLCGLIDWLIFFLLTLVNTFIVWLRKVVSTSLGIGKRWAAQSRMHSRVSLCPCQRTRDPPSTHALFSIFCNHSHVTCRGLIPPSHAETQDTSFYFLVWCKVVTQMYSTKIKTQAHFLSCHCSRTHNSIWSFQWFIHWNDWIVCPAK